MAPSARDEVESLLRLMQSLQAALDVGGAVTKKLRAFFDEAARQIGVPVKTPEYDNNPITNTIRPVLPLAKRTAPPNPNRPAKLIEQFMRATLELWRWVAEIRQDEEVIPLGWWVGGRSLRIWNSLQAATMKHQKEWEQDPTFGSQESDAVTNTGLEEPFGDAGVDM